MPEEKIKTTCTYCGVGCVLSLGIRGKKSVSVRSEKRNEVNRGRLCVKGRYGFDFVSDPARLTKPLIKKDGEFVESSWDEALSLIADKFKKYKKNKFAALSSAKCTNEENYLMQKFTRSVMGTNNVDHCARLCHAPSVAGLVQSFGSGAMTNSIDEIRHAKTIFAIGTNTTTAHPVIAMYMKNAVTDGAILIVANPKKIELVRDAALFLQHRPGTDVELMMGMAKVIVDKGLQDDEFIKSRCNDYEAFVESLKPFDLSAVEKITGVPAQLIDQAAVLYATNCPSAIFYSMGITQHTHGTDNVLATSNLALLTGNVGKPSTGVNPLRGQNNVQGACDLGALPNVYPGYQKVILDDIHKKFEKAWGTELSKENGYTHLEIFDAADAGEIKSMYIMGENPMISEANSGHVREAIEKLEFLVVQDIFLTETAELADVVLPAASFAEKNGTFTNTERRVQRVRKALAPPGEAKSDWTIICELANKMGAKGFDFKSASSVFDEIASVSPIYAGINYTRIKALGLQWPCRDTDSPGTKYLHSDSFATADGKGNFKPLVYKPPQEVTDSKYPYVLTTDRSLYHFHTGTMTRKVDGLHRIMDTEYAEIHPEDAVILGISEEDEVEITSRRGTVRSKITITDRVPPGVVSMTFHFAETPTNKITNAARDTVSKIPETKVCAVSVKKL
jgi:formate dehydrogenase alpha subunit